MENLRQKIKKMKKKWLILGLICLVLLVFAVRVFAGGGAKTAYFEEIADTRDVVSYYSFSGNIDSKNKQRITSEWNNLSIETIYVKKGDTVREGDILYALDASDVENNLTASAANLEIARINLQKSRDSASATSAQTSFDDARLNLERTQTLFNEGAVSQAQLEQAKTQYTNAQAQLNSSQSNYQTGIQSAQAQYEQAQANYGNAVNAKDNRVIKSKVNGVVADIYIQDNSTLSMGDAIMDVVDYDNLIVEIKVDEFELSAVSDGKQADVYISALDKNVKGVITQISNQASISGNLSYFTAEVQLEQTQDLRVGLSAEVKVPNVSQFGVLTISMNALQFDAGNNPFVYTGNRNNPVRKDVKAGRNNGVIVEITEGLSQGDVVLVPVSAAAGMAFGPGGPGGGMQGAPGGSPGTGLRGPGAPGGGSQ